MCRIQLYRQTQVFIYRCAMETHYGFIWKHIRCIYMHILAQQKEFVVKF